MIENKTTEGPNPVQLGRAGTRPASSPVVGEATDVPRVLRGLGAFEQFIDLISQRAPLQFSLVAELNRCISGDELVEALRALQDVHPMLRARTGPTDTGRAAFLTTSEPIPLSVLSRGTPWQSVTANEAASDVDAGHGPLARAFLVPAVGGCVIGLTVGHQVCDGMGAVRALVDLVALLDGASLVPAPVPSPQEDLLQQLGSAAGTPPEPDPRLLVPAVAQRRRGRRPFVTTLEVGDDLTQRLVRRCRDEQTTVHAALCAAATAVLAGRGRPYARIFSPVDLRRAADLPDEVVDRFLMLLDRA